MGEFLQKRRRLCRKTNSAQIAEGDDEIWTGQFERVGGFRQKKRRWGRDESAFLRFLFCSNGKISGFLVVESCSYLSIQDIAFFIVACEECLRVCRDALYFRFFQHPLSVFFNSEGVKLVWL